MNRILVSILKVLGKHEGSVTGSREIARELKPMGVNLSERTVRYHMKFLDECGFTQPLGKEGRLITERGKQELAKALVSDRLGFVIARIDTLSYLADFDPKSLKGNVILNISYIDQGRFDEALQIMKPVFSSPYIMSGKVAVAKAGQSLGDVYVPEGKVAFGTVCSVTINGILLKAGIPVTSRFGGGLEIAEKAPSRFLSLISYEGSSLDPLEVFIRSGMTDVSGAAGSGDGRVLASFREIPAVCMERACRLAENIKGKGIGGVLKIGQPSSPLFEVPVGVDRAGVAIIGGLNPIAALQEAGIPAESKAMSTLYEYSALVPFENLL